jgi:hypothetical protein
MELCPALGIGIPVGKDSLSMQSRWQAADGRVQKSVSPVSLIVTAFARVEDVRGQLTPMLNREVESELWLIGLGAGQRRMGGSILGQCYDGFGGAVPDLDEPATLRSFFDLIQEARADDLLLAYHDRSDGGAFAALCEMAFASHLGLELNLDGWGEDAFRTLFNEELGAIVQVAAEDRAAFADLIDRHELTHCAQRIGKPVPAARVRVSEARETLAEWSWTELFDAWWSVTHAMQALRDEPGCADEERAAKRAFDAPPLGVKLGFDATEDVAAPFIGSGARPRVAILREQGVNGQTDMAAAFDRAGFAAIDVHMSDLIAGRQSLRDFTGLAACGGFSYGDVLGAGRGWATSILERPALRDQFAEFFARGDSFSLGVCNGCQMLSQLKAADPRCRTLAAFPAQSQRAVRGAPGPARSAGVAFAVPARHGRLAPARGGGTRRGAGRVRLARAARRGPGGLALCRRRRQRRDALSGQSEWLARGHHRTHQCRWPQHLADAASRARVPQRAVELASGRVGRGLALAADVPQCPAVGGLRCHRCDASSSPPRSGCRRCSSSGTS